MWKSWDAVVWESGDEPSATGVAIQVWSSWRDWKLTRALTQSVRGMSYFTLNRFIFSTFLDQSIAGYLRLFDPKKWKRLCVILTSFNLVGWNLICIVQKWINMANLVEVSKHIRTDNFYHLKAYRLINVSWGLYIVTSQPSTCKFRVAIRRDTKPFWFIPITCFSKIKMGLLKQGWRMWIWFIWLTIGTNGGLLWTR
jgi:hypothetical protein